MKKCIKCELEKEDKHYLKSDIICNTCYRKELKFIKTCNKCKSKVKTDFFTKDNKVCDFCFLKIENDLMTNKRKCNKCNAEKDLNRFNKNICYDCINIDRKNRIKKGLSRKYPTSKEVMKKWRDNNKDRLKEYRRNYSSHKYKTDINYKLKVICRSFLNRCLYSKNGKRTLDVLCYSTEKLKQRLEYQFTKDMSWDNYGTYWNIDHRKPISLFKDGTDISIINSLCNLKPVKKEENFSKQNRFIN